MLRKKLSSSSSSQHEHPFRVDVTRHESIKPSPPTPPHLRTFKLSLLDGFFPPEYTSILFFYPSPNKKCFSSTAMAVEEKLAKLRSSLPSTLSCLYPLAGRVREGSRVVDCNDQGVAYVEAKANQDMSWLLSSPQPKLDLLAHFAQFRKFCDGPLHEAPLTGVKVTAFECGGMVIGLSMNHRLADAHVFGLLMKEWADAVTSRCSLGPTTEQRPVSNIAASLFPVNEEVLSEAAASWNGGLFSKDGRCRTQRFVFDPVGISELKNRLVACTRTEAILGLLWKCATEASSLTTNSSSSVAFSMVNLRSRFKYPLTDYSLGNLIWSGIAHYDGSDEHLEPARMANLVKRSVREVDVELLDKLTGEEGHKEISKWQNKVNEMCIISKENGLTKRQYDFTSLVNMGLNRIDFGWGKPAWLSGLGYTEGTMKNTIALVTAVDESIEAWVTLDEREMDAFERDPELLQYATVNPSVVYPDL